MRLLNKRIISVIIVTAFLLNVNCADLLADVRCDALRAPSSARTPVVEELQRSIPDATLLEARYSTSGMAKRIDDFIAPRRQAILANDKAGDFKAVGVYIDTLDAERTLKVLDKLDVAPIYYVEAYQNDSLAVQNLLEGKLSISMPFGGTGSRNLNSIRALGITEEQISDAALKLANVDIWQVAKEMGLIDDIPEHAIQAGLAQRQMLALEQGIINLKKRHGLTDEQITQIRANLKLQINISDDIKHEIHNMFLAPSKLTGRAFFGLSPKNVVFIEGGYGTGYELSDEGRPFASPKCKKISWNHGYAFIEQAWLQSPRAYTLTGQRDTYTKEPIMVGLDRPVFDYILARGAQYGCVHRVNDLVLLHPDMAIDVEMFGAFLSLASTEGIDAYFEFVANPTVQKGGISLTTDGKYLKVSENLATRHIAVQEKLDDIGQKEMKKTQGRVGIPYARLYGYYTIEPVKDALVEEDMPLSISYSEGIISPEIPIQDITWLKKVKALAGQRKKDRLIEEGLVPNELRDKNNNPILDKMGKPIPAYSPENGGSGALIHDCKAAEHYNDAQGLVSALDDPNRQMFEPHFYLSAGEGLKLPTDTFLDEDTAHKIMRQLLKGRAPDKLAEFMIRLRKWPDHTHIKDTYIEYDNVARIKRRVEEIVLVYEILKRGGGFLIYEPYKQGKDGVWEVLYIGRVSTEFTQCNFIHTLSPKPKPIWNYSDYDIDFASMLGLTSDVSKRLAMSAMMLEGRVFTSSEPGVNYDISTLAGKCRDANPAANIFVVEYNTEGNAIIKESMRDFDAVGKFIPHPNIINLIYSAA